MKLFKSKEPSQQVTAPEKSLALDQVRREWGILLFTGKDWSSPIWVDRHFLSRELAKKGWHVGYSAGLMSIWERHTARWHNAALFGQLEKKSIEGGSILVDAPGKLETDFPRQALINRFMIRKHSRRLVREMSSVTGVSKMIAYICNPRFELYANETQADRIVFHVNDAWWLNDWWTDAQEARLQYILSRSDLVVAVGESMAEGLRKRTDRVVKVLPHGVDAKRYFAGSKLDCPEDLANIPYPRIGYLGRVSKKVDLELIATVAKQRPDWNWVLVGDVGVGMAEDSCELAKLKECQQLSNVYFLGRRPQSEMPRYMSHMHVNALCYRTSGGYWAGISPLKLHELFAVGRPIVASPLPDIVLHSEVVGIAVDTEEWIEKISLAINGEGPGTPDARQKIAYANSWESRSSQLEEWICEICTN